VGDWAGPFGALVGFGLGLLEYKVMSGIVVAALRRTERSATEAEHEDYERRIRILRIVLLIMTVGGTPVAGYWIGRALSGLP
jgi:hypothetical protein